MAFVCLLRIDLHFPDGGSLKGKRRELQSIKAALQRRFGASVAETAHHELWQRAELSVALVARESGEVARAAAGLERFVHSRFPDGARVERQVVSTEEVLG
jgi:uncharacterized protein YlxP (DUF503 family)